MEQTIINGGKEYRLLTAAEKEAIHGYDALSDEGKQLVTEYWATRSVPMVKEGQDKKNKKWAKILICLEWVMVSFSLGILLFQYFSPEILPNIAVTITLIYVWFRIAVKALPSLVGIVVCLVLRYEVNAEDPIRFMTTVMKWRHEMLIPSRLQYLSKKMLNNCIPSVLYELFMVVMLFLTFHSVTAIALLVAVCLWGVCVVLFRMDIKDKIASILALKESCLVDPM